MSDEGQEDDGSRVLRLETAISWLDLRLEVASSIERLAQTEDIELSGDHVTKVGRQLKSMRGSRSVEVSGDYTRHTYSDRPRSGAKEIFAVDHSGIREKVHGGVEVRMAREYEAIVGGGYTSQNVGPFVRVAGMWDTMCWGGWAQVDLTRADIALLLVRAYFYYTHNATARIAAADMYFDDFLNRVEYFGTLNDHQAIQTEGGGPGSGVVSET